jgi:hypothetical protein
LLQEVGVLVERRRIKNVNINYQEEVNIYTLGKVSTKIVPGTAKWDGYVYSAKFSMEVDIAALNAHLDNIVKQKEEEEKRRLENERKVSDLELALEMAKRSLKSEQDNEKPFRNEKERKQQELQEAKRDLDNAQESFDRAKNASNAHTDIGRQAINNAGNVLQSAERKYNIASAEFSTADRNWNQASKKVKEAEDRVCSAQKKLDAAVGNFSPSCFDTWQLSGTTSLDGTASSSRSYTYTPSPSSPYPKLNIGLGGMANFYFLDKNIYQDQNTKKDTTKLSSGPSVGLITGISFTEWLALYSEFYYSYRVLNNDECSQNCTKIKEHALSIPLLVEMTLKFPNYSNSSSENIPIGIYIEGGALFGIPLKTTVYTSSTYIEREKFDLGVSFGSGILVGDFFDFGIRFDINKLNYAKNAKGSFWAVGPIIRMGGLR